MKQQDLESIRAKAEAALASGDFVVYPAQAKNPGHEYTYWDTERSPSVLDFLGVASKLGIRLITVSQEVFTSRALAGSMEDLREATISRDELREFERELKRFQGYDGFLCVLQFSFTHEGRPYTFHLETPWYSEYLDLIDQVGDLLDTFEDDDDDDDEPGGRFGYLSKN
ncbi:MAG: hypothetical protein FJW39_02385 [Acidobacteria bacterium]|nr:hypothetical protein [Acidobacteriota bacterium]